MCYYDCMERTVLDWLEELENAQGRNAKEDILRSASKTEVGDLLKKIFYLVDDPYVNFGVSKFKMPPPSVWRHDDNTCVDLFTSTLECLDAREATGNAARKLVTDAFANMNVKQQKWCQRMILRNLRVGVQASTSEKIWPGVVRHFNVALAGKLQVKLDKEKGLQILSKISYPVFGDCKLDGLRCLTVKHAGKVTLYSRSGKEIVTCQRVRDAIANAPVDDVVLDGEMLGSKEGDWNAAASVIMSSVNKKDDAEVTYNVFDTMSYEDWAKQENNVPFSERTKAVKETIERIDSGYVKYVVPREINSEKELLDYYAELLEGGSEGIMIKDPKEPYVFDRSDAVRKLKPVLTVEGTIVSVYAGRVGTSRETGIGGWEVLFETGVITRIGSGSMTSQVQADVMLDPQSFIGRIVECNGQPDVATTHLFSKDGKLRFPRFIRFRDVADVDQKIVELGRNYLIHKNEIV